MLAQNVMRNEEWGGSEKGKRWECAWICPTSDRQSATRLQLSKSKI
ncbi:hypothetical protein Hdeb2414_s0798g00948071 [Helianthus debilis subsp. tardiflorus]